MDPTKCFDFIGLFLVIGFFYYVDGFFVVLFRLYINTAWLRREPLVLFAGQRRSMWPVRAGAEIYEL